jgi:hypothetical protein
MPPKRKRCETEFRRGKTIHLGSLQERVGLVQEEGGRTQGSIDVRCSANGESVTLLLKALDEQNPRHR